MDYKNIGKYIKEHRINQNLSIVELSELSSVDTTIIDMCERGHTSMSLDKTISILNALNINFSECFNLSMENSIKRSIENKIMSFEEDDFEFIKNIFEAIICDKRECGFNETE